ncbi:hypothetical protein ACQEVG_02510 [Streptomyces sp. CA-135486]|uniref:hypothetical protein n=1 Tax=Streptomyces sp. CA-135486 TaxID=3240049 RepID=UPI003D9161A5
MLISLGRSGDSVAQLGEVERGRGFGATFRLADRTNLAAALRYAARDATRPPSALGIT